MIGSEREGTLKAKGRNDTNRIAGKYIGWQKTANLKNVFEGNEDRIALLVERNEIWNILFWPKAQRWDL